MATILSELAAELTAIRESAARARGSIDRALAECAVRETGAVAREDAVRCETAAEWRSWTADQRRAVTELFSPP